MVLKKNHRSRRGNSVTKLVITLAFLLLVGFGGGTWYVNAQNKEVDPKGQVSQVIQTTISTSDQSTWSKLRDQDNSFEVKFPKNVFKRVSKQVTSPLPNQEKIKSVGFAHLVPAKCGSNTSQCSPTTTDMALDFFTVSRNFNDVFKDLQRTYGQNMPVVTIDDHQGVRFGVGSKREGIVYTVLPISNSKTLFIARSYLNEEFDATFAKNPEFIKYSEQKSLFDQIIATLTFRPTI